MTDGQDNPKLSKAQIWLLAARPRTLPAAVSPVIVGISLALADGLFRLGPALAALLTALLLQIAANVANDVFDFYRGADTAERLGPLRVTQAGLLTPRQTLAGMWVIFGLTGLLGLYLTYMAGWPVILIGLAAIAAAILYTGGPLPFGYYGLGDLVVFVFFGLIAVGGTYYVQAVQLNTAALWASVSMGLLTTNILVVNNLRDIETDRKAGKLTLAVRLGEKGARLEYLLCLAGAYLVPWIMWLAGISSAWVLLSWLSIPVAVRLVRQMYREKGRSLNLTLAGTGKFELLFAILFSIGLLI
ncbi:MAG: 1,4-dihydroxy-2-naphthoate polyprenyltransferase [Anaerolineales bacterium]|nr:1,4-dihydroxy-2-naphthoate polyprenyltransferase [Anaerolineales bacterium]